MQQWYWQFWSWRRDGCSEVHDYDNNKIWKIWDLVRENEVIRPIEDEAKIASWVSGIGREAVNFSKLSFKTDEKKSVSEEMGVNRLTVI